MPLDLANPRRQGSQVFAVVTHWEVFTATGYVVYYAVHGCGHDRGLANALNETISKKANGAGWLYFRELAAAYLENERLSNS